MRTIRRGEVYWCDFSAPMQQTYVQKYSRPVIIMQNDLGNANSATTIVVPLTTQLKTKLYPTQLPFYMGRKLQIARTEQIQTIDKTILGDYIDTLSEDIIEEVERKIHIAIGAVGYDVEEDDEN